MSADVDPESTRSGPVKPDVNGHMPSEPVRTDAEEGADSGRTPVVPTVNGHMPILPEHVGAGSTGAGTDPAEVDGGTPVVPTVNGHMPILPEHAEPEPEPVKPSDEYVSGEGA